VGLADVIATLAGSKARRHWSNGTGAGGSVAERVAARFAWLADDARVRAYEIMGDRPEGRGNLGAPTPDELTMGSG
jgi:hypothetical protein